MAVKTDLDEDDAAGPPPDGDTFCRICGRASTYSWVWFEAGERWVRTPGLHDKCVAGFSPMPNEPDKKLVVPERFQGFEAFQFKNDAALAKALDFDLNSEKHVFAVMGDPGKGKSRLAWNNMQGFFAAIHQYSGRHVAPECLSWPDLVTDPDPYALQRFKAAKYAFLDDCGSTDIFGRARAMVQAVLRHRLSKNTWTWLTIDDTKWDEDFIRLLKTDGYVIWLD